MPQNEEKLEVGVGCTFENNSGQEQNGSPEVLHNPLEAIIQPTEGMNIGNPVHNISASNVDQDGGPSGEHRDPSHTQKRLKRHTTEQLQKLESFYEKFDHPDEKRRSDLANEIGLEPVQVKFWFQNKRTQMKALNFKNLTTVFREENRDLKAMNKDLKKALKNARCSRCASPVCQRKSSLDQELQLQTMENFKLKKKIAQVHELVAQLKSQGVLPNLTIDASPSITDLEPSNLLMPVQCGTLGPLHSLGTVYGSTYIENKEETFEKMVSVMDEFKIMAEMNSPLWLFDEITSSIILSETVYLKGIRTRPIGFRSEASKETTILNITSHDLVTILMDGAQWSRVFSEIVAKATTLEVVSTGDPVTKHRALHLINAEFQVASPLVQTRESYFLRYCFHHPDGCWTVTDISSDDYWRPNNASKRCQKKPSGCRIEDLPEGYSKITWVEHVEVETQNDHQLYIPFVSSGLAFGAKRMISIIQRHCEHLASITEQTPGYIPNTIVKSMEGKRRILEVAERMVVNFHNGAGTSTAQGWIMLPKLRHSNTQIMVRYSEDDHGHPLGTVLSAAAAFSLPVPHETVFGYLTNHQTRHEWNVLSYGRPVKEIAHFQNATNEWNHVSLLQVLPRRENDQNNTMILQKNYRDSMGSSIIYAPVDCHTINEVLIGGNPDDVALLPSGLQIYPDGSVSHHVVGSAGSLVTVAFQILLSSVSSSDEITNDLLMTISNLIDSTVGRINDSMRF